MTRWWRSAACLSWFTTKEAVAHADPPDPVCFAPINKPRRTTTGCATGWWAGCETGTPTACTCSVVTVLAKLMSAFLPMVYRYEDFYVELAKQSNCPFVQSPCAPTGQQCREQLLRASRILFQPEWRRQMSSCY